MKIFGKTFLFTLILLVLIALLANGLIYSLMPRIYTKQKRQQLNNFVEDISRQLEASRKDDIVRIMSEYARRFRISLDIKTGEATYSIMTWNGGIITVNDGRAEKSMTETHVISTVTESEKIELSFDSESEEPAVIALSSEFGKNKGIIEVEREISLNGESGRLTARLTLAPVDEAAEVIITLLPLSILICLVVAVIFSFVFARNITNPVKAISEETRRMKALEPKAKCAVTTKDEIGVLAENVNNLYMSLLNTIESLEKEIREVGATERRKIDFLRAASHELKTPVTAAMVIIDNMIMGVGKYRDYEQWLPRCRELLTGLSEMLQQVLSASSLDETDEPPVNDNIKAICLRLLEPYRVIARARGISLYTDFNEAFIVMLPQKPLEKAVSNIISNAVQYTISGGRIAVYCRRRSLIIENECTPISEKHLSRLFEPFYRPDESRDRDTGGNGLGLYIADSILNLLELKYSFTTMPEGMRFTIKF